MIGPTDQLFDVVMATAVDGVIVIDERGGIKAYNPACEKLFGYAPGEVLGRNVSMLVPAPQRSEHDGHISQYRNTGEKHIIGLSREVNGQRKDLSTFPMYLSVGEGQLDGARIFVGIIHDLTALRAETAQHGEASSLLAQIVRYSDDAILSKTIDGTITSWNAAAERIFGYSAKEAVGKHISILIPDRLLAEEAEILAKLHAGEEIRHYETVRRRRNGEEIFVSLSVALIKDGDGHIVGASKTVRDFSEKRRAEIRTRELQDQLAHVARLTEMGQMSAAIAHEMNQPLSAIMNYVRAAQRLLASDPMPRQIQTARDAMAKAATQTGRAGAIIRHLREFMEKRSIQQSPEDINAVIEEAVGLALVGTAQLKIRVRLDMDPQLPKLRINKVQIQQVMVNLVRNSIDAMAGVERRELSLRTERLGPDQARIIVRDSGHGLTPEIFSNLFQPFVTSKLEGMGIGLNICRSIVEAHGGRIRALPGNGSGATFEILLPGPPTPEDGENDAAS